MKLFRLFQLYHFLVPDPDLDFLDFRIRCFCSRMGQNLVNLNPYQISAKSNRSVHFLTVVKATYLYNWILLGAHTRRIRDIIHNTVRKYSLTLKCLGFFALKSLANPYLKMIDLSKLFCCGCPSGKKAKKFSFTPSQSTLKYGSGVFREITHFKHKFLKAVIAPVRTTLMWSSTQIFVLGLYGQNLSR